jgi:hypothetical protein
VPIRDTVVDFFRYLHINRNTLLFLFFLLISSVAWLLTSLNRDYSTNIRCQLEFTDLPGNKVFAVSENPVIDLNVTGHGYTLAWFKVNPEIKVPFSLRMTGIQSGLQNGVYRYWLLSRQMKEKLQPAFSSTLLINSITPDTLYIDLCEKVSRKVPVIPDLNLRFARQYMLCGPVKIIPDSVIVSGPRSRVDTLQGIHTHLHRVNSLKGEYHTSLSLEPPHLIITDTPAVDISICAEKFTESEITVPIQVINLPEGISLKAFPPNVQLTYRIGLSKYKEAGPDLFTLSVDFREAMQPGTEKLPVVLQRAPAFVEGIKYNPHTVDYIIEK